eukprot:9442759-Ditylum_brightwellii.AAC.1
MNTDAVGASDYSVDSIHPTPRTQYSEGMDDGGSLPPVQGIKISVEQLLEVNDELLKEASPYNAEPSIVATDKHRWKDSRLQLRYLMSTEETQWVDL